MNPPKRERNALVIARYRRGETLAQIGKLFGICDTRVWQILRREGVQTRKRGSHTKARKRAPKATTKATRAA